MARILIVEDDQDLVETYTDLLEAFNHSVFSAGRVSDAISMVTRHKPAVIVLDLNLPGDSGVIIINLVSNYKGLSQTKIIVATGHPEILQETGYISKKVDAILTKPVGNDILMAKINELISEYRQ
ncbi:MAG TPA: response regulator [Phototrophicaceae bacterium]|nr:response regulator [Phototrophicaceae bacterium]